jgi:hypothetical protein
MKRKILLNSGTFTERDVFGRKTSISFHPAGKPGWYLRYGNSVIPIDYKIAFSQGSYIQLRCNTLTMLNIYEHIGVLRWLGYDGVEIEMHDNKWPPYGGAVLYLEFFSKELWFENDGSTVERIAPQRHAESFRFNTLDSSAKISFTTDEKLHLNVVSHWKGLPPYSSRFLFEELSPSVQSEIWTARPQGYPHYQKRIAQFVSKIGWPNKDRISWKGEQDNKMVSREWFFHAVQDTLGALSLCDPVALPTLSYHRVKGGHFVDLDVIKKAFQ